MRNGCRFKVVVVRSKSLLFVGAAKSVVELG